MKDQFLKLAGVKSEKEFYKKFPTEEAFMAKYGKQVKKLNLGGAMTAINKLAGSNAFATGIQSLGDVVGGIQQMKDEKQQMLGAQQMQGVSNVALQASMTRPEQVKRRYATPPVNTGEEFFPVFGTGTNALSAKNGAEIANTFAPNTIYTDLEEAFDGINLPEFKTFPNFLKDPMKQGTDKEVSDIYDFAKQGGGDALAQLTAGIGSPKGHGVSGAGKIGGGIGATAGMIIGGPVGQMIGKFAGQTIGNLVDRKAEKTEEARKATDRNMELMALNQGAQALQRQNYSYMKDGGFVNPQVASSLEGIPMKKLFAPDPYMDTLRAGGHLKSYTPPSERSMYTGRDKFAMGGNLKTHWGGGAELMSYNPYLPEGGETIMFKGQFHDESDGKGNTGIGITYGDNLVEVEEGEPAVQLRDGSDGNSNLTVYGNLKIPKFGAQMIGDPKASGKKFKNYVAELSKTEQRQNTIIDKSTKALDGLDVNNSFNKLSFDSYQAMITGADMNLKKIAKQKKDTADLQSAINDTADEFGLVADDLAKGKIKQAKMGVKVSVAKDGITKEQRQEAEKLYKSGNVGEFQKYVQKIAPDIVSDVLRTRGLPRAGKFVDYLQGPRTEEVYRRIMNPVANELPGSRLPKRDISTLPVKVPKVPGIQPRSTAPQSGSEEDKFDWMTLANQILPYVRPTNAEQLDPRQLSGEMYALATNQVMPVDAQLYQPELPVPYDISLQDIMNKNEADYRAGQRMMGYNPAAQAMLNAQKYQANQQVLGEQFRMNQAMKNQVYDQNRQILNDAKLKNLDILDRQFVRQQEALSNTKATTQAALNSISAKYAQNQLENRKSQTLANMYKDFGFDPRFRAIKTGGLAQFDTEVDGEITMLDKEGNPVTYVKQEQKYDEKNLPAGRKVTTTTKSSRNGALVKAMK